MTNYPEKQKDIMRNSIKCIGCRNNFSFNKYKPLKKFCSIECYRENAFLIENRGRFKKGNKSPYAGKKMPNWLRKKISISHQKTNKGKGNLHYKWNGGSNSYWSSQAKKIIKINNVKKICGICNSLKAIHIHHKNRNRKNNNLDNLILLCRSCHSKLHHKEDKLKYKHLCEWCEKIFYSRLKKQQFCNSICVQKNWKANNLKKYKLLQHKWYLKKKGLSNG